MTAAVGTTTVQSSTDHWSWKENLPQELFQPSYVKAIKTLAWVLCILTTGYVGLAIAPWYTFPISWFIIGTACMGLVSVANDCEKQSFVRSRFLNESVGTLILLPMWMPFCTLSDSARSGAWLNWGPLWLLRSLWHWLKANFALPITGLMGGNQLSKRKKRLIVNLVCIYGFVCIFFPLMTMTFGIWGIFKYYVIPMIICHFWMSTCLKMSDKVQDGATMVSYPRLVEFLGNNFTYLANSFSDLKADLHMPSYNFAKARSTAKECSEKYQEVSFGWDTFFSRSASSTAAAKRRERIVMRVHGQVYDLTQFKHPGGPVALSLGSGRDATSLFESHHPFTPKSRMNAILNKYRVAEESQQDVFLHNEDKDQDVFDWSEFTTNEASFGRELITEVKAYFQKVADAKGITLLQATKADRMRWIEMAAFSAVFLALVPLHVQGYWFTVIALPVFAWLYAAAIAHDAMHFSVSTDWRVNVLLSYVCPWTASPLMWYHQHVIGHHSYPNVPFRDPDLAHAPGFLRLHDSVKWKPNHRFQNITVGLIWTFGATLYMTVVPIKALAQGVFNRCVALSRISKGRVCMHVLGRIGTSLALWGWQWYVFRGDLARQVIFTVLPMLVHSICFMVSTQFNHLTTENTERSSRDFYKHQVVTSHSFSMSSLLMFWFTGGLNVQIEHHLFPTVNHCHLRALSPIVRALCVKHNVYYHESKSVFEALQKHFAHVSRMSSSTHKAKQH